MDDPPALNFASLAEGIAAAETADPAKALTIYARLRAQFPAERAPYHRATALLIQRGRFADAEEWFGAGLGQFPDDRALLIGRARIAQQTNDFEAAISHWQVARERFPGDLVIMMGALPALYALRRLDEADTLTSAAKARFPAEALPAAEHATVALRRQDWPEAARRYAELRQSFPSERAGFVGGATAERRLARFSEAEALLAEGMAHLPDDVELALEHAQAPAAPELGFQRDWPQALRRLGAFRQRFPDNAAGVLAHVRMLRAALRYADAEALAVEAMARFPGETWLVFEWAGVAEDREDWAEAEKRFATFCERSPERPDGLVGRANALARLKRADEAEALATDAIARFPRAPRVFVAYANVALLRGAHAVALKRWNDALTRFPTEESIAALAFNAQLRTRNAEAFLSNRAAEAIYMTRRPARDFADRMLLHDFAAATIGEGEPVLYLEFGVARGATILRFAQRFTNPLSRFVGFDSFKGLPEDWEGRPRGFFSTGGRTPETEDKRVSFVKGWFQNTVPDYLKALRLGPRKHVLVHFDADVYSSTLFLLASLWPRFPDYHFVFDELPGEEVQALQHFARAFPVEFEFYGQTASRSIPAQIFGRMKRVPMVVDEK